MIRMDMKLFRGLVHPYQGFFFVYGAVSLFYEMRLFHTKVLIE